MFILSWFTSHRITSIAVPFLLSRIHGFLWFYSAFTFFPGKRNSILLLKKYTALFFLSGLIFFGKSQLNSSKNVYWSIYRKLYIFSGNCNLILFWKTGFFFRLPLLFPGNGNSTSLKNQPKLFFQLQSQIKFNLWLLYESMFCANVFQLITCRFSDFQLCCFLRWNRPCCRPTFARCWSLLTSKVAADRVNSSYPASESY